MSARSVVPPSRSTGAGASPKLFAELTAAGFEILTYRKAPCRPEPRPKFTLDVFTDDRGRQEYWLVDRAVRISYKDKTRTRRFARRQAPES